MMRKRDDRHAKSPRRKEGNQDQHLRTVLRYVERVRCVA
jgi:hypothetical protein